MLIFLYQLPDLNTGEQVNGPVNVYDGSGYGEASDGFSYDISVIDPGLKVVVAGEGAGPISASGDNRVSEGQG